MRPTVAVFDFTGCEGCQLQILNCEPELPELVAALDIVTFREAMTGHGDRYDIAFIDGACTRQSEIERLERIRQQAERVIPIGACACLGGVNCLKNQYDTDYLLQAEYGAAAGYYDIIPARPISAVIPVDFFIPGCPIVRDEFIRVVQELLAGRVPHQPGDPVCAECKLAGNVCVFDRGMTCLGPVTRGGCRATCVTGGAVCWGCRGLIDQPNIYAEKEIMDKAGLSVADIMAKFNLFNGYQETSWQ